MIARRSLAAALFPRMEDGAPRVVRAAPENESSLVRLADGTVRLFYMKRGEAVCSIDSRDGGLHWTAERWEFAVAGPAAHACVAMADGQGELHVFFLGFRGEGRRLNVDRFLDIWHARTAKGTWQAAQRIYQGYCGSVRAAVEMRGGRLVAPFAEWVAGREPAPPYGSNEVTAVYSDDGGRRWRRSAARLRSPCVADYNGSNYGAVEPCVTALRDGRLWMLMRTQTGRLYESFSRDGVEWSEAAPSRFWSSNSPAALCRLRHGALLVVWNNCLPPPRFEGQGVYGGRDALHVAISRDDGQSWEGFREVYLDPARNETPPQRGDRATAYPFACETESGHVLVVTGQGEGRRAVLRFHPDWVAARQRESDLRVDAGDWCTYESFGPAKGYWRDRRAGATLVDGALDVRAGASWNFPALRRGALQVECVGEAWLTLSDHFRDPAERDGGCVRMPVAGAVTVEWDEGGVRAPRRMGWERAPLDGISYVRLHPRTDAPLRIARVRARPA